MSQGDAGLERFVKSFGFSLLCFAVWAALTILRARALFREFAWMEAIYLVHNSLLAVLFLIRTRPSVVSLVPIHWIVALLACFSGLFFETESEGLTGANVVADGLILVGLVGGGLAAIALRRSYDFLPALRGVTTDWLYSGVRHPMYVSTIVVRLGYVLKHLSAYNAIVFVVMMLLYDRRAGYEEQIMRHDPRYRAYAERVRYRFVPGIY